MDQVAARKILQELIKREDLDNKKCMDCANPNPQWASLSFAVFLCLQCAGVHRGFGVHISFVRSVSMDTWQEDQIKRMQLGGNAPFREFMETYPSEQGGYKAGMSPPDMYQSWAASQYKEKLDASLAGKPWSPSAPPENTLLNNSFSPPGRPSSAQGLRKSRASTRTNTGTSLRRDSASPASFSNSPIPSPNPNAYGSSSSSLDQKSANESFFATLGASNATRPADLPPSQGGRYQGFGNTPSPQPAAYALSSANAPSLNELKENPTVALSKGWSLLSAAVAGASRAVTENVLQPGIEKVRDPAFQAGVRGVVVGASARAQEVGRTANMWGKSTFGVDVAGQVGGVVGTVREKVAGGPERRGYGAVGGGYDEEGTGLYSEHDDDDFFGEYSGAGSGSAQREGNNTSFGSTGKSAPAKKADDWDEWKDF